MDPLRLQRFCGSKRPLVVVAVAFFVSILIVYGRDTALKILPLRALEPKPPTPVESVQPVVVEPVSKPTPPFPTAYVGQQRVQGLQHVVNPFEDGNDTYRACLGPNNQVLSRKNGHTMMSGFSWESSGFPEPIFGSYESWGLNRSMCTNRASRYGAYGYVDETHNSTHFFRTNSTHSSRANLTSQIQWDQVDWANLQQACLERNQKRFRTIEPREKKIWTLDKRMDSSGTWKPDETNPRSLPRTAVILRTWLNLKYTENDLHHIRAMIMEMSLHSGGEYEVVLLVDCQNTKLPDPRKQAAVDQFKEKHLPKELREMAVFFNKEILHSWYSAIDVHEAILQYYQPVQIYSRLHPQYDYIWQFEMDSRYTGHYYSLVHQATEFAKQQPRKNLWERNSHFYIPAVHGSWKNFTDKVDRDMAGRKSVWGAMPAQSIKVKGEAPIPPVSTPAKDNYEWGVGEEADLITWLPHFDPADTNWPFRDRVFKFPQGQDTPRRSAVVAMSRVSKKLLRVMHKDKAKKGYGLASEMSCLSWALYYGLKAVQVPLPLYHEHEWDPKELNRRVNAGEPGRVNAGNDSAWSWDLNHDILLGTNFMFASDFAEKFYRAWMGLDSAPEWEKKNPPLCLPPIFLHPVKNTQPGGP